MKQLNNFINEKLKISSKSKINNYKYHPKTSEELRSLISERIKNEKDNIDFNDIDVSDIKYFGGMFSYKNSLTSIDISNWDMSSAEDLEEMFIGCRNLKTTGDLSKWYTPNLTDITGMFYGCENLEFIGDLNKWNYSKITRKQNVFNLCKKLKDEDIPKWYKII